MIVEPHPALRVFATAVSLPEPLESCASPDWLVELLSPDAAAPLASSDAIRAAVRDALRHDGYRPTGRGKPASEYLARAAVAGHLSPINLAVDLGNAVSLHSGIPISIVDLDRTEPPLRVGVAGSEDAYVFNSAGHEIRLAGLPCLFDAQGACANAVKDSMRTKTGSTTTRVLCVLWGCVALHEHAASTHAWFLRLAQRAGATCESVA